MSSGSRKYLALFWIFLKASAFTFGGGLAMIPVIERDVVERHGLLTHGEFMEYATLSQSMPGTIAINCAALVGGRAAGAAGMLIAGFGAILPTFVLMVVATILAERIPGQGPLMGAMRAIRASSAAMVVAAAVSLGKYNIRTAFAAITAVAAFLLVLVGRLSAPLLIVISGAAGIAFQRLRRAREGRDRRAS